MSYSPSVVINYTAKRNTNIEWECSHCTTVNPPSLVNCQSCFERRKGLGKMTADDLEPPTAVNNKQNNSLTGRIKSLMLFRGKSKWNCPQCTLAVHSYLKTCTACGAPMPPGLSQDKPTQDKLSMAKRTSQDRPHVKLSRDKVTSNRPSMSTSGKASATFCTLSNHTTTTVCSRESVPKNDNICLPECLDDPRSQCSSTCLSPSPPPPLPHSSLRHQAFSAPHDHHHHKSARSSPSISNPSIQTSDLSDPYKATHTPGAYRVPPTHTSDYNPPPGAYRVPPTHTSDYNPRPHIHKSTEQFHPRLPPDSTQGYGGICWVCPFCGIFNFTTTTNGRMCYVCGIGQHHWDLPTASKHHTCPAPHQVVLSPAVAMETDLTHSNGNHYPPTHFIPCGHTSGDHTPHSPCDHTPHSPPKLRPKQNRPTELYSGRGQGAECRSRPHSDEGWCSPVLRGSCRSTPPIHSIRQDDSARANILYQKI